MLDQKIMFVVHISVKKVKNQSLVSWAQHIQVRLVFAWEQRKNPYLQKPLSEKSNLAHFLLS